MQTGTQIEEGKTLEAEKTGKNKFLTGFLNFLMYGGFLIVLIVIVGIVFLVSYLTK
jgi:hypothetical protein